MNSEFWNSLDNPKFICAPMVDASELAFRSLTEDYNCNLGYTPMFHSGLLSKDKNYCHRQISENFSDIEIEEKGKCYSHFISNKRYQEDIEKWNFKSSYDNTPDMDIHRDIPFKYRTSRQRKVFTQLSGHDAEVVLAGARHVEYLSDAVDLNFGCPQDIARRGHYGAFLLEEWSTLKSLVSTLYNHLDIPVTCKMRILPKLDDTLALARMLQDHGASALTVHGRTRHCKQDATGAVDLDIIAKIKSILRIPVIANGGVETYNDAMHILEVTKCDAVMSAEGLLENPCLFDGTNEVKCPFRIAREYLEKVKLYPCADKYIRGHLFKILYRQINRDPSLRTHLAECEGFESFVKIVDDLEKILKIKDANEILPTWYRRHRFAKDKNDKIREEKEAVDLDLDFTGLFG